ncbi:MAG: signal recognition particle protein [Acidimicrobiia bacterium]
MFDPLADRFGIVFSKLRGKGRLSEADVDAALREVRLALLEADVNVGVVKSLLGRIRKRAVGRDVRQSLTPAQEVIKIVHEELIHTLGRETAPLVAAPSSPLVVLMAGLQGSGKTTSAAKLARLLEGQGKHPLLVAADLRRPAAVEQLVALGGRAGVPVFTDGGGTPVAVVTQAIKQARRAGHDAVIIDTSGRLHIDRELMSELSAVRRAADPHEVLLVVDAMTGQDAVNVARAFLDETDITGIVLSKLDGDARGGAAISAREVTGRPIKFAGVGEDLADFEVFHPERMASRILGMGDVLTLIEKAEAAWDERSAARLEEKLRSATFTFEDFLEQFQQVRRMGPLSQLLGMLPGAASLLGNLEVSDRDLARVEAIIRSMTPDERRDPRVIGGSRKRRIAAGSGTRPQDVNALLRRFGEAQKLVKMVAGGGFPGLPVAGRRRKR